MHHPSLHPVPQPRWYKARVQDQVAWGGAGWYGIVQAAAARGLGGLWAAVC